MKPAGRGAEPAKAGRARVAAAVEAATTVAVTKDNSERPFPQMAEAAYHGLAGDVVRTIFPHTEADPAALLLQLLATFGNIVGRTAYYQVEADRHYGNLFGVLVGATSRGRKGTSASRIRSVVRVADERWTDEHVKTGLSSGEGLIAEVRDESKKYDPKTQQFEVIDPGIVDKRVLIEEPEFANALAVMDRPGNTLSPVLRNAWDGRPLSTLTKNSPLRATNPHISVIAHISEDELRARLSRTDAANGFGNRFLFCCVKRSKLLPFGGDLEADRIVTLGDRVAEAATFAKTVGRVIMAPAAQRDWVEVYAALSHETPGLLGAITARAEAQTVRLALLYALLDRADEIDRHHLHAALAVWEYAEASAGRIFGNALGDPIADEIVAALHRAGSAGLTRTAIRDLFGRNRSGDRIGMALALLLRHGRARPEERLTAGRPAEVWIATGS